MRQGVAHRGEGRQPATGVPQATWYRRHRTSPAPPEAAAVPYLKRIQPWATARPNGWRSWTRCTATGSLIPPLAEVWATLLDEATCLGSACT
jgi:putative transposase